jgi:hypothetical protein
VPVKGISGGRAKLATLALLTWTAGCSSAKTLKADDATFEHVHTKKACVEVLTLVDETGNIRAMLGPAKDGQYALSLYGGDGNAYAWFGVEADGTRAIALTDGVHPRVVVTVEKDGTASLSLIDKACLRRISLDSEPSMTLYDEKRQPVFKAP